MIWSSREGCGKYELGVSHEVGHGLQTSRQKRINKLVYNMGPIHTEPKLSGQPACRPVLPKPAASAPEKPVRRESARSARQKAAAKAAPKAKADAKAKTRPKK